MMLTLPFCFALLAAEAPLGPPSIVKPPALRLGDTIAIVGPASPTPPEDVAEAVRNIRKLGYEVRVAASTSARFGYLAGDDEARTRELMEAFLDPAVRVILCARGGYGSPRILDRLDYAAIRKNPKILVGYSDLTALLLAVHSRAGVVTFHGPMAGKDFSGRAGLSPFASRHFFSLLDGGTSFAEAAPAWGFGQQAPAEPLLTLAPGEAEGPLLGGNLSTIAALLGTPFEPDFRGVILFLEDVNEEPFRIDRMLCQLRLSGKLAHARGIVLGAFTRCVARSPRESLTTEEVLRSSLVPLRIPVLAGYPSGHLSEQVTLPIGVRVRLNATAGTLSLVESAVETMPTIPKTLPGPVEPK